MIRKILSKIDDHVECIRYLWPDRRVSVLFKVLNFFSCDRLRTDAAFALMAVKDVHEQVCDIMEHHEEFMNGELTPEQYRNCMTQIKLNANRAVKWTEDIFKT